MYSSCCSPGSGIAYCGNISTSLRNVCNESLPSSPPPPSPPPPSPSPPPPSPSPPLLSPSPSPPPPPPPLLRPSQLPSCWGEAALERGFHVDELARRWGNPDLWFRAVFSMATRSLLPIGLCVFHVLAPVAAASVAAVMVGGMVLATGSGNTARPFHLLLSLLLCGLPGATAVAATGTTHAIAVAGATVAAVSPGAAATVSISLAAAAALTAVAVAPASKPTSPVHSGRECFDFAGAGQEFDIEFLEGASKIDGGSWASRPFLRHLCPTSALPVPRALLHPLTRCPPVGPRSSMHSRASRRPRSSESFSGVARGGGAEAPPRRVSHRPTSPSTCGRPRRGHRRTRGCYAITLRPCRPTTRSTSSSTCATGPLRESGATGAAVSLCLATTGAAASACSARARRPAL